MSGPVASLRSSQIVVVALAAGVATFTILVAVLRLAGVLRIDAPVAKDVLPLVVLALAVAQGPVYLVVCRQFRARIAATRAESLAALARGEVPGSLQALTLIGAALAESVGLLGTVTLLLGGPWFVLVAPVLAISLILAQLPTRERLETFVRTSGG